MFKSLRVAAAAGIGFFAYATSLSASVPLTVHVFAGGPTDGAKPTAGVVVRGQKLYGTTCLGGAHGAGTVYEINAGTLFTIHDVNAPLDGVCPHAKLVAHTQLFGTMQDGGPASGGGTVFQIKPNGNHLLTTLHSFDNSLGADGDIALGSVAFTPGGVIYGTTFEGGVVGDRGAIYTVVPPGPGDAVIHYFSGAPSDGADPYSGLVYYNGFFYGTTSMGGTLDQGTVYMVDLAGNVTLLYSFTAPNDGQFPDSPLLLVGTTLYGTTLNGGANNGGTLFSIDVSGSNYMKLWDFGSYAGDGLHPTGALEYRGNKIYGTTRDGGTSGLGTAFHYLIGPGTEPAFGSFNGANGSNPLSGLTYFGGWFYGTTSTDSGTGFGTVFKIQ